MQAKPLMLASVVCAALLAAGCGERAQTDAVARNDKMAQPVTPPAATPPATAPGDRAAMAIDDTALTAKVKTALIAEPGLKSTSIDVTTKEAVVTLSGNVETAADRAKARQVAENVQGVRNVVDRLTAKS